ncbi:hypothetical protein COU58_00815 [Candidatus Pacearchaeota archaeon CG10_big_fil_rev_8_21_14_0_10_32_42]|nr:MAG: hypothetical protein COU58_00815 [Candidatus Pacearchaeota archaeon CG10_big_fil_rev_8_21_14_0_10_32_42]
MSSKPEKLTAVMIIEVMGRPKEHLIETLEDLSLQVNSEKGVTILNKKIKEPTQIPDKDLFTAFVELEFEIEEPLTLMTLMFKYMPSHVEVIEPENFTFKNSEFNELFNEITRRLHRYEELVRVLQLQLAQEKKKSEGKKDKKETSEK